MKVLGRATGRVVIGESKQKGTPYIECYFNLARPVTGPDGREHDRVRWTGYFHDKKDKRGRSGAERVIESMQTCGWDGDDLSEFGDNELHGLDANEVELVCEFESYERDGETLQALRVQWINRPTAGVSLDNAMSADKLAVFAERMRGFSMKLQERQKADTSFNFGANAPAKRKAF